MSKSAILSIFLAAGILVMVIYLVMEDERPVQMSRQSTQARFGEESRGKVWSGYVYWDERDGQLKFRPCGEQMHDYALRDQDLKSRQWSRLVDKLQSMPYMPRFTVLVGQKSGGGEDRDIQSMQVLQVRRIDPRGNCKEDRIVITKPLPGAKIDSPLVIQGRARGSWFFEGDFPVLLTNWDGLIIAQGIASAQEEWMTEDFVPFTCRLTFDPPSYGQRGTLILRKDNPSDNPALNDALEIPVRFMGN